MISLQRLFRLFPKSPGDADVQTQKVAGTNEVIIKTKTLDVEQRQQLEEAMAENFGVDADKITAESISGAVSTEMKKDAVWAVSIATILMLLYIWFGLRISALQPVRSSLWYMMSWW